MPQEILTVHRDDSSDRPVVRAVGEVDSATAPLLADALAEAIDVPTPPPVVVADLREVTFLGSNGLTVLVTCHENCQRRGIRLAIAAGSPAVRRVMELTSLDQVLDLVDEPADALPEHDAETG
jgi:anti-sigma B factor antagonist